MSDSENDDDYCPTKNDEKEFSREVYGQNQDQKENGKLMTEAESLEADEILKSFKLNLPIKQSVKVVKTPEIKSYDFAGETIQVDEETGLEHR